jgi:adenine-specific DNA-methyltransferase
MPSRRAPTPSPLLAAVEERRQAARNLGTNEERARLGQFLTPSEVARSVAALAPWPQQPGVVSVLDPGAGVGSLTAALVDALPEGGCPARVSLVACEVDGALSGLLAQTLGDCREEASRRGTSLSWEAREEDYLLAPDKGDAFDLIVMNPPYHKISTTSPERAALDALGVPVPNLYAAFMARAATQLAPGGLLVAIVPRSFANGAYYKPFRRFLFDGLALEAIHAFGSRRALFSQDEVLQENVIVALRRGVAHAAVRVLWSEGPLEEATTSTVPSEDLLRPGDAERVLLVPTSEEDLRASWLMGTLPCSLVDLDVSASTGRVVEFRARDLLLHEPEPDAVPLVRPQHIRGGRVSWPGTDGRRPCALRATPEGQALALPSGHYAIVRRLSSKEESRRVVAAALAPDDLPGEAVAFENHVNVLHREGHGLGESEARGLALYLSSGLVDRFVRVFSGHTQVNASDLRYLRYPSPGQVHALGALGEGHSSQEDVDQAVEAMALDWATKAS